MNIKSLLLGSAAALAAVSGTQAADAIVAAEPEPMEYVRVCDAFGTGFFYIPGTETCLKIAGYVRFQVDVFENAGGPNSNTDWDAFTRAQLDIDTKSDSELGTVRGFIGLRANADNSDSRTAFVDQAFIELGGLKVGYFYSWWDDDLSGETDVLSSNTTLHNSVKYTYDTGTFRAAVSVDELDSDYAARGLDLSDRDSNVGVGALLGGTFGAVTADVIGSYDVDTENGAVRAIMTAGIGPGTFGLAGIWASGRNAYYQESEWTVAAEYKIAATDRFSITPGVQYFNSLDLIGDDFDDSRDAWKAGVTLDYKITEDLTTKLAVNYTDADDRDDVWDGFFRLQRSF